MVDKHPLQRAIDEVWDLIGDRTLLLADLPADAVLARARSGERRVAAARVLELLVSCRESDVSMDLADEVDLLLGEETTSGEERNAVLAVLDCWWRQTLMFDPGADDLTAGLVLARLARIDVPLVRWLEPWLVDLDGPPARHLAELVLTGLDHQDWVDVADRGEQVRGWSRSEPVVMGITLVGGVHLGDGVLSSVLDELLAS